MNDSRIAPVFQILAEDIHALGVRTVFGLMSDDTAVFAVTLDGLGVSSSARGTRTMPSPWPRAMPTPPASWAGRHRSGAGDGQRAPRCRGGQPHGLARAADLQRRRRRGR